MIRSDAPSICALCGGTWQPGVTTFTAELGFGVVVVRNVPALVCTQCGGDWIADPIAERLEEIVTEARRRQTLVEVVSLG
ncbi:MAG: type II toxin-antitoxin system MqsA family antitoxin [Chloroflexi bacterium]|nr:type II toxin-antitoxin system MqsA family antitoxin [Chloroflexota bacterium]